MAEFKLCENTDCERYPPDWDFEEDTEDTYQEGQWRKCCLCAGYFDDDGLGDILFVQEEPNNQEDVACQLCGKDKNIVQMKGTGEYICEAACDEDDDSCSDEEEEEGIQQENTEKKANCDFCCEDKSFETYYTVRRGRQIYFSCNDCWENRETQIVAYSAYTWEKSAFPGPAFMIDAMEEQKKILDNAKRFYYLRKTCYRGMLRYNKKGEFNIPFGRYKNCNYQDLKNQEYENLLKRTHIFNTSFEDIFEKYNDENNFMFLDPPYDSEFTDYGYCTFGKDEQRSLAKCFKETKIKCLIIIGKTPFIEELYKDYIVGEYDKKYRFKLHSGRVGDEINTKHLIIKNY